MGWWSDFDRTEVAADFARIAASGLDSVRLFLTWADFQPADEVDRRMLNRLVAVADLAAAADIALVPTLFTGHMSGVNWVPAWALGGTDRDDRFRVVSNGRVNRSALRNWYRIRASPERRLCWRPRQLELWPATTPFDVGPQERELELRDTTDPIVGAGVAATRSSAIRAPTRMPGSPSACTWRTWRTTACSGHARRRGLRRARCTATRSMPAGRTARPTSSSCRSWPISRAGCGRPRRVVRPEFGLPTYCEWRSGRRGGQTAESRLSCPRSGPPRPYTERALAALQRAGCVGAMLWCYTDYDQAIWADPPLDSPSTSARSGSGGPTARPPSVAVVEAFAGRSATRRSRRIPVDRSRARGVPPSSRTWSSHASTLGIARARGQGRAIRDRGFGDRPSPRRSLGAAHRGAGHTMLGCTPRRQRPLLRRRRSW